MPNQGQREKRVSFLDDGPYDGCSIPYHVWSKELGRPVPVEPKPLILPSFRFVLFYWGIGLFFSWVIINMMMWS